MGGIGLLGRERFAAEVAAQLLKLVHLGLHRRLTHDPDQYPGDLHLIDLALVALRTRIPRLERFVGYPDLLGAGVGVGAVAAMAFAFGGRGHVLLFGLFRRSTSVIACRRR